MQLSHELHHMTSPSEWLAAALFGLMTLPDGFLQLNPYKWDEWDDSKQAREIVCTMKVVNDQAKQGFALVDEFSVFWSKI